MVLSNKAYVESNYIIYVSIVEVYLWLSRAIQADIKKNTNIRKMIENTM